MSLTITSDNTMDGKRYNKRIQKIKVIKILINLNICHQ
jgi:hypothetical protein